VGGVGIGAVHFGAVRSSWRWWWVASILVHSGLMGIGLATAPARSSPSTLVVVTFELPPLPVSAPSPAETPPALAYADASTPHTPPEPDPLGGAHNAQNLAADTPGERGDGRSLEPGRLLAAHAERVNLSPHLLNTLDAMQEHRLRTARARLSPQDRRATPNPGYDPWIASSSGVLLYRLPFAPRVPAPGATASPGVAHAPGAAVTPPSDTPGPNAPATTPGSLPRPQAGVTAGVADRSPRTAGPAAFGRASIERGHASTTAERAAARPQDNLDAEALATTLLRNALATSVQAGPTRAAGSGGVGGGGAPGSGGTEGPGGRARPYGEGEGWLSLHAPDARYQRYFQQVRRSLDPLWAEAFPREEMLRMRQGRVILRFVIQADGRVARVSIHVPSGIEAFDRNVVAAIAGARLPPIPPEWQLRELRITHEFVFRNPLVR
jgi:TonB family protein